VAKGWNALSVRGQLAVLGMLSALSGGAAWQSVVAPARANLAAREARLAVLRVDVARARATAARLPAFEREVNELEASLRQATAILPDEKDPQDVLRTLHELASESALNISHFTPKPPASRPQFAEWPIELGLEGSYHDLGRFFDRVATMSRLMSVSDLNIKVHPRPAGDTTIAASCVATTFVFAKDASPPQVAALGAPKGTAQ
jgi:Tfp pilus assembly protein PilO